MADDNITVRIDGHVIRGTFHTMRLDMPRKTRVISCAKAGCVGCKSELHREVYGRTRLYLRATMDRIEWDDVPAVTEPTP